MIEAAKLFFGNENLIDNDGCKQDGDRNDPRHGDLVLVGRLVAVGFLVRLCQFSNIEVLY